MQALTDALGVVNDQLWTFVAIPLLVVVSLYFTVRSKAVQLRLVPEMARTMFEPSGTAPDGKKAISSFQAFSVSAAARVGTGNVAGVAIAIALGGPGAVLWMWVMGIIAGSAAFVESTLAQLYKVRDRAGYRGGPAYYMLYGLRSRWLGAVFAVVTIFTFGFVFTSVQANSIVAAVSNSVSTATGAEAASWLAPAIGVGLVVLIGAIVLGGVRRIAHVAQTAVPFMALIYLLMGIAVVAMNIDRVPAVLADIVASAFGLREIGAAGVGTAIMMGIRRGLFSNEAGMGSAPNAGATAAVSHPVKQGLTQTFGVYFDTLVVCSITAFIILVSNPVYGEEVGASLTQNALEANLGTWSLHMLTLIIFLLAFTSALGNYYYGESNLWFLTSKPALMTAYRAVFLLMLFIGSVASLSLVWTMADVTMGVMVVLNLAAILPMGALAVRLLKDYTDQRKQGLNPVFTRDRLPGVTGVQCWDEPETADRSPDVAVAD
ncbi:alanine:cation symporter family protein [Thermobifida halotolerans]|uniref:Alanine:cation symporter family protein n=1 Tax=Thermobifida halotolerans TaxID=483545 RepID=A0A399FZD2_9ACTN|nr:alanine/glycine:cation symporter family protein [Thermobifida halotolerans]UOE18646.1 alanine:cation symporter family protein [Thermobifida halotolerans]